MLYQEHLGRPQTERAEARYHRQFRNDLYDFAIKGKSTRFADALKNEAMALCGHPHYKLSHRRWSEDAMEFLWWFAQTNR